MPETIDRLNTTASPWSPRQLVRRALLGCIPRSRLLESLPGTGAVYLTFDDGPHPEHTPHVLNVLAEHGAQATFFVLGSECSGRLEILKRMIAEGHTIGNHSYSHLDARAVSRRDYLQDMRHGEEAIRRAVGQKPRLFRPPYGKLSAAILLPLLLAGPTIVLWNVDVRDYEMSPTEIEAWLKQHPLRDGDILLMHDVRGNTPTILPLIIDQVAKSGLHCRALPSDLAGPGVRRGAA